jgi:hypothetical protein
MLCLVVSDEETWVDVVKRRSWVFALANDGSAINVAEEDVKFVGLVWEATIVIKDVLTLLATHSLGDANRFGAGICGKGVGNEGLS